MLIIFHTLWLLKSTGFFKAIIQAACVVLGPLCEILQNRILITLTGLCNASTHIMRANHKLISVKVEVQMNHQCQEVLCSQRTKHIYIYFFVDVVQVTSKSSALMVLPNDIFSFLNEKHFYVTSQDCECVCKCICTASTFTPTISHPYLNSNHTMIDLTAIECHTLFSRA